MAARRVRSGANATTYWLIAFVFLFVITLGLAIMFYHQRSSQQAEFLETQQQLDEYATSADRADEAVIRVGDEAGEKGRSIVRQLITERQDLHRAIGVGSTAELTRARADQNIREGTPLLAYISTTRSELARANNQLQQQQQQLKQRDAALAELGKKYEALRTDREQKMAELTANLGKLQADLQAYQQQVGNQQTQLSDALAKAREDAEGQIRGRDTQLKKLQDELAKAQLRIKELQDTMQRDTPDVPDLSKQGDGHIVAVNPDQNLIYMDLGSQDHLVLGMTFEVFDSTRGVEIGQNGDLRGKATVEVVDIGPRSSSARIVRSSFSRPILPGDVLANLVYDKNRKFNFYVFGNFDLDGDGQYTISDHDAVVQLIERWGGVVVNDAGRAGQLGGLIGRERADQAVLPLDTDFVVVGQEPDVPPQLAAGERDPAVIQAHARAKQKWDEYLSLRNEAAALSIPVINQNRFLALIGHTGR